MAYRGRPIPTAFCALVVTANVGHIPSTCIKVGLSIKIPAFNLSSNVFIEHPPSAILLDGFEHIQQLS